MKRGFTVAAKVPMYIQLRELIRKKIEDGIYKYGDSIPSERELSIQYGLNRMTVRQSVAALVEEGLLTKSQGKGTFVTRSKIAGDIHKIQGFGRMVLEKGLTPGTKVIHSEKRKAGFKFASIFNISEEALVYNITRIRLGENEPISLEDTYIPYEIIPDVESIDFELYSLYELFKANGVQLDASYESLTLVKVRNVEAKLLNLDSGSTVFSVEVKTLDISGRVVEYTRNYTNGDKCSFYSDSNIIAVD
jgi:GntR family transcriptional regulator